MDFAYQVAGRLRLQIHQRADFNPAHFAPHPLRPLEEIPDKASLPTEPTLYLYGPIYAPEGGLKAVRELAVDTAEGLFNALLLAYFELEVLPGDSELHREILRNAKSRLPQLPPEHQVEALIQGLANFGSHVLTVANQLNRLETRNKARGKNLCPLLDQPGTLFGLWDRIFRDGVYLARFFRPAAAGELSGHWVETSVAIAEEDKELVLRHVFHNAWKGDRRQDLAPRFCPPVAGHEG